MPIDLARPGLQNTPIPESPSVIKAFIALTLFSFYRQWRIRQMAWVALGLLGLIAVTVALMTHVRAGGWGLPERFSFRFGTQIRVVPERLNQLQGAPLAGHASAMQLALTAPFRALLADQKFLDDWAFLNFSRWTVFTLYLGFLLPLFTLAYASGSIGAERESRTLIWLVSRPLPRSWIYLAKFLGTLPWCLVASLGGFVILCLCGGQMGLRALELYWPAALAGTIAFSALFQLIGALFRRPAIVGLVYVFFFETLVASLPGSLKQLSLNYYVKSMLYNSVASELSTATPDTLDVYAPANSTDAWLTLIAATLVLTALGMWLFQRQEPKEEI